MLAATLVLLPTSLAFAQPSPPPVTARPSRDWAMVDRRARTVVRAGWITGVSGLGLEVLGLAVESPTLFTLGALGEATGAPLMAGGSLRSRRAVNEMGGSVSSAPGAIAWSLWGGGLLLNVGALETDDESTAGALVLTGLGCRIASYAAAGVQQLENDRERRGLGVALRHLPAVAAVPRRSGASVHLTWTLP